MSTSAVLIHCRSSLPYATVLCISQTCSPRLYFTLKLFLLPINIIECLRKVSNSLCGLIKHMLEYNGPVTDRRKPKLTSIKQKDSVHISEF